MTPHEPAPTHDGPDDADTAIIADTVTIAVTIAMLTVVALLFVHRPDVAPGLAPPRRPTCVHPTDGRDAAHRSCLERRKAYDRTTDETSMPFVLVAS